MEIRVGFLAALRLHWNEVVVGVLTNPTFTDNDRMDPGNKLDLDGMAGRANVMNLGDLFSATS